MLSGMAVELTEGDAFIRSLNVTDGPLRAYKDGRQKGLIRKASSLFASLQGILYEDEGKGNHRVPL